VRNITSKSLTLIVSCIVGFAACNDSSDGPAAGASAGGSGSSFGGASAGASATRPVSVGGSAVVTSGVTTTPAVGTGGQNGTTTPILGTGGQSGPTTTTSVVTPSTGGTTASSTTGSTPTPTAKFVGNITTRNSLDTNGLTYSKYWNQVTPENAGKWGSVQSSSTSAYNWNTLDAIYDYATKNNILFKHHVFVWGSQQPSDASSITEAKVKDWMTQFCKRYPKTALIDVVNEPPPHTTPAYAGNIGGGTDGDWKWIINAFKWAREACPTQILILNDYNNIEWDTDANHFIDIVKKVKAGGAPIDAVGCQAHDLDHSGVTADGAKKKLAALNSQTGLPVYITEFDISTKDDASQLDLYKSYIPFFLETDYIKGVTIWGWIVGATWDQAPDSGLVTSDGKSRPAMKWLMDTLGRSAP
jgi:endo-1,4-beta-xylanase